MLSLAAVILAVVWLGNAAASILLRDPYPVATLAKWIPLVLVGYSTWHVLKVAWKRPQAPIEWNAGEQSMVCGGPFPRHQVLAYRLGAVMGATVLKALLVSVLLLADFPIWPVGFIGTVLALAFLELLRMALETFAHGANRRTYLLFRAGVFGIVVSAAACAFSTALRAPMGTRPLTIFATTELLGHFVTATIELRHTAIGTLCQAPFVPFGRVITASNVVTLEFAGWLLLALSLVAGLSSLVFMLDRACRATALRTHRRAYCPTGSPGYKRSGVSGQCELRLPRIPRLGGAGTLVWRQVVGAFGHRFGLLTAFLPPTVLALLPLAVPLRATSSFLQVVGGLIFYSFLLLPAALKFDFRRDYDRLCQFKTLPLSPPTVVLGQIATPVVLTSVFQLIVLIIAASVRPVPLTYLVSGLALMLPLNVLIFSLENLVFLLSPCRPSQEGIEVLLRSILVFTAKGVLLAVGLVVLLLWLRAARCCLAVSRDYLGATIPFGLLFTIGTWALVSLTALASCGMLVRTYRNFDPSLDGDR